MEILIAYRITDQSDIINNEALKMQKENVENKSTRFVYEWADPGGTAIPGQPVAKVEQALYTSPRYKNQFNIEVPHWGTYQILS